MCIVYQVPNRGRQTIEGGGFYADFRAAGHMLVASGWQADIAAGPGIETMVTPIAKNPDGSSITGPVMARFLDMPAGATTLPIIRGRVTGTATPASFDTTKATLTRRTSEDGSRVVIAPAIGRSPTARRSRFPGQPDPIKVCLKGGFDPAFLYELTYVAKDPPVHGIGFAATRDLIAFLRKDGATNPLGGSVRHAVAQGTSQSGNYLRSFLSLGFNQDERGQRVFDGMNAHIAARQLAMNIRFAAPSGAAEMFEPGSEGTLWWDDYTDTARGRPSSSLLARCRATEHVPEDRRDVRLGRVLFAAHVAGPGRHTRGPRHPAACQRAPLLHRRASATAAGQADSQRMPHLSRAACSRGIRTLRPKPIAR